MKKFLSLIFVLTIGGMLIVALANNEYFTLYGDADTTDRVSQGFIDRDVNGGSGVVEFEVSENLESGPANIVTAIVADYRSFDTLGEITVLFVSSLGVALLLGHKKKERMQLDYKPNFMLKVGSRALFPIILVTGIYIAIHGHLTPGGGFPGGAMIASSILLLYLADDRFKAKISGFKVLESFAGITYVLIGIAGLVISGFFLENFLPNGTIGTLFSSGIIPIVYVLIGLKVGSEITGIIDNFLTEEAI
jgi:multicomponent Na+:H+ antiporter subunit B